MKTVKCDTCGYEGGVDTYKPTISIYSDIRCPECGSTNNRHNSEYLKDLQAAFKKGPAKTAGTARGKGK